jgi:hypothetical protein
VKNLPLLEQRIERAKAQLGQHWVGHPARRVKRLVAPKDTTAPTVLNKRFYQPKTTQE